MFLTIPCWLNPCDVTYICFQGGLLATGQLIAVPFPGEDYFSCSLFIQLPLVLFVGLRLHAPSLYSLACSFATLPPPG